MQGTVAHFDETTRSGHVLTALAEHIRHLRVGQRVFIETGTHGITRVSIWP
jgi:hypothetical protein